VHIDLGTGDGRAVLAVAAAQPATLVIGIDAAAEAMAEASRRAARPAGKGGNPNAAFVVDGVEMIPRELRGLADRVTVLFPWGSLLRGALALDPAVCSSIARLVRHGGSLELAMSVTDRDRVDGRAGGPFGPEDIERIAESYSGLGLTLVEARRLTRADPEIGLSSWARRLGVGATRPGWRIRLDASEPATAEEAIRVVAIR
jgi:16S rRNA (adenine(1408)-N(1))-methyltransferase